MCRHAGFRWGGWCGGNSRGSGAHGTGPVRESGSVGRAVCVVFSPYLYHYCSCSLLFAVLLNCPYPDPPVFCLFLSILLRTLAGGGVAAWCFCCQRQPKPEHLCWTEQCIHSPHADLVDSGRHLRHQLIHLSVDSC